MFEKLFKDIPKMVRLFTKIIGVVGIVVAVGMIFLNLTMLGSVGSGMGLTGITIFIGFLGTFLVTVSGSFLIILIGEIVARVYSVWEKKNSEVVVSEIKVEANTKENTDEVEISEVEKI